jgi:peptidoglycan/xylan/chitin deacetylase (PgdA/CDA1 family)
MASLIFMYHDLANDVASVPTEHRPYVLETAVFNRQVDALARHEFPVVTVAQWYTSFRTARTIMLTFDDGHVSNHDLALPILCEYKLKATFYVTAGFIGTGATMNWGQIRALHAAGMEVGSHTMTHRPPLALSDEELRYELTTSRDVLENGLGAPVTSISSPTGFFNPRMKEIAREAGYRTLCFGQIGLVTDTGDPFSLNRIAVKRTMGLDEFDALLRFDRATLRRLKRRQLVPGLARKTLGSRFYLPIRRALMGRFFSQ